MENLDSTTICFLIAKARELEAKAEETDPDSADDDLVEEELEELNDEIDDPLAEEIRGTVETLNDDEQAELVALLWVGRGDFTKDEWDDALVEARETLDGAIADYLLRTPLLGDLLEEGMNEFGLDCHDVELARL